MALSWIFWYQQSMLLSVAPDKNKKRKKTKRKENCHAEAKSLEFILFTSPAGYLLVTLLTMPLQEM